MGVQRGTLLAIAVSCALGFGASPAAASSDVLFDVGIFKVCVAEQADNHVWCSGGFGVSPAEHTSVGGIPKTGEITSIAAGVSWGCVTVDGAVYCWSRGDNGARIAEKVPGIDNAVKVDTNGNYVACALLADRTVKCWNRNTYGGLGNGLVGSNAVLEPPVTVVGLTDVTSLAVGGIASCATKADGTLWCWGWGVNDPLGLGFAVGEQRALYYPTPTRVGAAIDWKGIASVDGDGTYCAAKTDGTAACWPGTSSFTKGFPTITGGIKEVPTLRNVQSVGGGGSHFACALSRTGVVSCWGGNDVGQSGNPATGNWVDPAPVAGLGRVSELSVNYTNACARDEVGIWCWGGNTDGQLGSEAAGLAFSAKPVLLKGVPQGPDAKISTTGPFTEISTTRDLRCGRIAGSVRTPPILGASGCGTWLSENGSLYGPSGNMLDALQQGRGWTPLTQDVSGDGSAGAPHRITTDVAGDEVRLTQTDEYVDGADHTTTTLTLENRGLRDRSVVLSVAGDCQHTDRWNEPTSIGFGWRSAADIQAGATGCSDQASSGQTLTWRPMSGSSRFTTNTPTAVGKQLAAQDGFDNACLCATEIDDAAGLSWSLSLAPGERKTVSYKLVLGTGEAQQPTPTPPGHGFPFPIPWWDVAIGLPDVWEGDDDPTNDKPDREPRTGKGQTVAIVDTGVDTSHPWFKGDVQSEACATTQLPGLERSLKPDEELPLVEGSCPVGSIRLGPNEVLFGTTTAGRTEASGSAKPRAAECAQILFFCAGGDDIGLTFFQGTFVAGLAAGKNPDGVGGVAPDANVIAANVSSWRQRRAVISNPNDAAWALKWVDKQRTSRKIAAVELMLPNRILPNDLRTFATGPCTGHSPALEKAIHTLTSHNIAVVMPAGDDGRKSMLPWPACLPDVISVGATAASSGALKSSNSSRVLTILAPGDHITSAKMNEDGDNATMSRSGTFAAAGLVTGAIALYKQHRPNATVRQVRKAMTSTGIPTADGNGGGTTPRLRVDLMLGSDGR